MGYLRQWDRGLPAGDYKVTVVTPGGSDKLLLGNGRLLGIGAGASGIVSGPLTAPGLTNATAPGRATFHHGAFGYPDTYDSEFEGQNRWVDVEVTPSSASPAPSLSPSLSIPAASDVRSGVFLTFFP